MIKTIKLTNLLSYGPDSHEVELRPLNLLIGANGSGKSNLIEAIGLLRAAPRGLAEPVKGIAGGGVSEWLWKGPKGPVAAALDVVVEYPAGKMQLRHSIVFTESGKRFEVRQETVFRADSEQDLRKALLYGMSGGTAYLNIRGGEELKPRKIRREDIDPEASILSQRKDPDQYPELYWLSEQYSQIKIYSDWSFGRAAAQRLPQPADGRVDFF
jgi:predicted ATPase